MQTQFILSSLSGLIVLNSIFFGAVVLINSGKLIKNRLLAFLLFGIAMRTGKSILMLLFPNVPDSVPAIGLIGMAAIGPLLYFYASHLYNEQLKWRDKNWFHFIFALVMGATLPFASNEMVFWLYFFSALHMAFYIGLTARLNWNSVRGHESYRWTSFLLLAITLIWGVYAMQLYFQGLIAYLTGTVVASLVLFAMVFFALKWNKVFGRIKAFNRNEKNDELSERLVTLMEKEKLYKDSDLTLTKLANRLNVKPYLVSGVLNEYYNKSFPEFINYYRIREAQSLLESAKSQIYSIEAIAYDCGFNTPSAFYAHFKKLTKVTPSEFRASLK